MGLALKVRGLAEEVIGVARTRRTLERALERGAIDRAETDPIRAVQEADLVYLATPVEIIVPLVRGIFPFLKPGALVTDAGSVKGAIIEGVRSLEWGEVEFLGGHPMAGSEKSGIEAACPDLFRQMAYILTPAGMAKPSTVERFRQWVEALGGRVLFMEPTLHDRVVAVASHLPHFLALGLMRVALQRERQGEPVLEVAAGSFRDATRVAMSDPSLWESIFRLNREAVLEACEELEATLQEVKHLLREGQSETFRLWFHEAGQARRLAFSALETEHAEDSSLEEGSAGLAAGAGG